MAKRRIFLEDIPLDEARAKLQAALASAGKAAPLPGEPVPLDEALGRVTAAPARARLSSPHFHCAAMDGYAVSAASTISARETRALPLRLGSEAFPVNTGDPLPDDTNAVIMIENVNQADESTIMIYAAAAPWQHVRLMGEDMVASETVLQVNHELRPVDLGALAGCGHQQVNVRRKPRVLIIPTGGELVPIQQQPERGQLIEYNSLILSSQIRDAGGDARATAIVPDDESALSAALSNATASNPDLILILSGSSAGSHDFTANAIKALGEALAHGIAVRPGHPVIIGIASGIPIIGVPGYPVSAALTGELFIIPLIRQWLGLTPPAAATVDAVATQKIASPIGDDDFLRVALAEIDGSLQATPLQRGAGVITSLVEADGLAHIPRFHEGVDRGGTLMVSLYRSLSLIKHTLLIMGSHDPMLDLLATHIRLRASSRRLVSINVGSVGGLIALRRGEAHIAGCHLFHPESKRYNVPYIQRYLPDEPIELVTFAQREQGLILPTGNPKGIRSVADLRGLRYINRQRGAGTRVLFDHLLAQHQLAPADISGYEHEEYTHLAVAAAVADGIGDCGMGLRSAAEAMGLEFIGVTWERFDLAIPKRRLENAGIQALLDLLRDDDFKRELGAQSGYRSDDTGRVVATL
ncbi:MAG: molybdopterin biosynthesis protein [Chloroflexota bacterium]|nr:molybdopterin biosynthesis protein [Chloroflexota bacterium]MDE2908877.1 molybdopterin biosynthesis protein [Chloroflexota bacterium]